MLMRRVPFYYLLILLYVLHFAPAADGNLQEVVGAFCSRIGVNLHTAGFLLESYTANRKVDIIIKLLR